MARKAIYMGPRLKAMRRDLGLTQANMAEGLEISASYIALMERNQRPLTAEMLLKLATTYQIDIANLASNDGAEIAARVQSVLKDPIFEDIDLPSLDVEDFANSFPGIAEAMLRLHTAFSEEMMSLAERRSHSPASSGASPAGGIGDPVAEARAFLAARRNFFSTLEDTATKASEELGSIAAMEQQIASAHGLEVRYVDAPLLAGALRWHDYHRRRVLMAEWLDNPARRFQLALQLAILEQGDAIEALLEQGRFASEGARQLVQRALQSYWAAALLMPYNTFHKAAIGLRYDVELLAARFSVSFEQAAHRLTTLQKPGAEGVPFFFLRVDQAGNVSKRLDGAGFPFARHAGGCPLWHIHSIFSKPGTVEAQLIELPDGDRFVSIARTVWAGDRAFGTPNALRAVALVCAASHIGDMVYGDGLIGTAPSPIGVACRICHRPRCVARSAPPIGREILPNRFRDNGIPFAFSGD